MDPLRDDMSLEEIEDELEYTKLVYGTLDILSEDYEEQKNLLDKRLAELERRIDEKRGLHLRDASEVDGRDNNDGTGYRTPFAGPDETEDFSMFPSAEAISDVAGIEQGDVNVDASSNAPQYGIQHSLGNENDASGYKKRYRLSNGLTRDTASMYSSKRQRTGAFSSQSGSSRSRSGSNTSSDEGRGSSWKVKREKIETGTRGRQARSADLGAQRLRDLQQKLDDKRRQEREDERLAMEMQGSQNFGEPQRPSMATAINPRRTIKDYAYGALAPARADSGSDRSDQRIKAEPGRPIDALQMNDFSHGFTHRSGLPIREATANSGPSSFSQGSQRILPWNDTPIARNGRSDFSSISNDKSHLDNVDDDDSIEEISPKTFERYMSMHERKPRERRIKAMAPDDQAEGLRSLVIDLENEEACSSAPTHGYGIPGAYPGPSNSRYPHNYMSHGQYMNAPGIWAFNPKNYVQDTWSELSNSVTGFVEGFQDLSNLMLGGDFQPYRNGGLQPYSSFAINKPGEVVRNANGKVIGGKNYVDLDAPRPDYIYGDPQKTKEEIKKLLENIRPDEELTPDRREGTPEAMRVTLMEHQKVGLTWLKNTETGSNQGGILADDMGLGKTIQALALIVSRPSEDPRRKSTLIVAPVSLMRQWDREIKSKLKPGRHKLSVYVHHGSTKKTSFSEMSDHDVVLTTFGTLASELKKKRVWEQIIKDHPDAKQRPKDKLFLIGEECKWYRVIIDEAQCIKNKSTATTQAACLLQAKYRLCMTGTPMMNNVTELYSLIHFLRIKPYCEWYKFNLDIGRPLSPSGNEEAAACAMAKLQALLKAICLRRSKFSKMDGKPILEGLPPRATHERNSSFSKDEREFYRAVETQTQLQFNRYLSAGTVGRNYTTILVLLLRLRQACCHPFLLKDFGVKAADLASTNADKMAELARRLEANVVNRIKAAEGAFECPICLDAVESPAIFFPCGHDTCTECFARLADPSRAIAEGQFDGAATKCPECRQIIEPQNVIDYSVFKKVHIDGDEPEAEGNAHGISAGNDLNTDSSEAEESDNLSDSASNVYGTLSSNSKRKGKQKEGFLSRDSGSAATSNMRAVADQKVRGGRGVEAKRKYRRRLRRNWQSSAKVDEAMSLLRDILAGDETEKILVFSQFTSLLDVMEVPIEKEGFAYRRYDGSMNANARNESILEFTEQRDVRIMLISLKAGNAGLNLNAASQVIMLDPFWNPYVEEQAIDRAHRIGQTRMVNVHRILVKDTVEDRILALQEKKRKLISTALDEEAGQTVSRLGTRELAYLFGVAPNPNPAPQA